MVQVVPAYGVNADVPLPSARPVSVPTPIPPFETGRMPVNDPVDIFAHAGAVDTPVDVITCPEVEPTGFNNWIGESVVATAEQAIDSEMSNAKSRFMLGL